jgi:hypothetical protein
MVPKDDFIQELAEKISAKISVLCNYRLIQIEIVTDEELCIILYVVTKLK